MYLFLPCLTIKHDICHLRVGPARIAQEMDGVFKSYKHQYNLYAELFEKLKQGEAGAKLNAFVSTVYFYSLNRNGGLLYSIELTNYKWCNDRFLSFWLSFYNFLYRGVSKELRQRTVSYLSVTGKKFFLAQTNTRQEKVSFCKSQLLNGCNELISAFKNNFMTNGFKKAFRLRKNHFN